jgi:hypothetical protein
MCQAVGCKLRFVGALGLWVLVVQGVVVLCASSALHTGIGRMSIVVTDTQKYSTLTNEAPDDMAQVQGYGQYGSVCSKDEGCNNDL